MKLFINIVLVLIVVYSADINIHNDFESFPTVLFPLNSSDSIINNNLSYYSIRTKDIIDSLRFPAKFKLPIYSIPFTQLLDNFTLHDGNSIWKYRFLQKFMIQNNTINIAAFGGSISCCISNNKDHPGNCQYRNDTWSSKLESMLSTKFKHLNFNFFHKCARATGITGWVNMLASLLVTSTFMQTVDLIILETSANDDLVTADSKV